jgi:hypothetical protein
MSSKRPNNIQSETETEPLEINLTEDPPEKIFQYVRIKKHGYRIEWIHPYFLSVLTATVLRITVVWLVAVFILRPAETYTSLAIAYTGLDALVTFIKLRGITFISETDA